MADSLSLILTKIFEITSKQEQLEFNLLEYTFFLKLVAVSLHDNMENNLNIADFIAKIQWFASPQRLPIFLSLSTGK